MNDDTQHPTPADKSESLGVWNNPELEARIVAMEMGELSAFEMAELTEELEKSPELRLFQERILNVTATIKDIQHEDNIEDDWKLPSDKRETILSKISESSTATEEEPMATLNTTSIQWRNVISVAACFLVSLLVLAVVFPFRKSKTFYNEPETISYNAQSDRGIDVAGGSSVFMELPPQVIPTNRSSLGKKRISIDSRRNEIVEKYNEKIKFQEDKVADNRARLYQATKQYGVPYHGVGATTAGAFTANNKSEGMEKEYKEKYRNVEELEIFSKSLQDLDDTALAARIITSNRPEAPRVEAEEKTIRGLKESKQNLLANGYGANHPRVKSLEPKIKDAEVKLSKYVRDIREKSSNDLDTSKQALVKFKLSIDKSRDVKMLSAEDYTAFGKVKDEYEREFRILQSLKQAELSEVIVSDLDIDQVKSRGFGVEINPLKDFGKSKPSLFESALKDQEEKHSLRYTARLGVGYDEYDQTRAKMLMDVDKAWEIAVPPANLFTEGKGIALSKEEVSKELAVLNQELGKLKQQVGEDDRMLSAEDTPLFENVKNEYETEFNKKQKLVEELRNARGAEKKRLAEKVKFAEDKVVDNRVRLYELSKRLSLPHHGSNSENGGSRLDLATTEKGRKFKELEQEKELLEEMFKQTKQQHRGRVVRKELQNTTLPDINFKRNTTVEESLAYLQKEFKKQGKDVKLNIVDNRRVEIGEAEGITGEAAGIGKIKLGELALNNVPADEALRQIAEKTGLRYRVKGDGSVEILRATDLDATEMYTRSFRVPAGFKKMITPEKGSEVGDPFDDAKPPSKMTMNELLRQAGVPIPDGSEALYSEKRGTLTIRNTANNIDLVERLAQLMHDQKNKEKAKPRQQIKLPNETSAIEKSDSTFSLNVSDSSFQLARAAMLEQNKMPTPDQIRVEEFVNAFDYGDPSACGKKVTCAMEQAAHPFFQQRNLMRIGMKTGSIGRTQPLRLTILLDNSGSMERADRAETVQAAIRVLASKLTAEDEVTLISFSRTSRLVAEKVKGNEVNKIAELVKSIPSEGGTNLSAAMEQAYAIAKRNKAKGALSRIILITDGAANLGNAKPEDLAKKVITMRQNGIAFDACGVGVAGINDEMLEALTRKGDGRYYFINKAKDADAEFAQKLAGALRPAAKNVKVQVIFNPQRVGNYRLLGFEKHLLKKEEFRDDKVDAAEMAAEEAGNALYQVEAKPNGVGTGDIGRVFVRFRDTESNKMVERSWAIPYQAGAKSIDQVKPSLQLSTVAAMLAERLKYGERSGVDMQQLSRLNNNLRLHYSNDKKVMDLIRMCEKVK